MRDIDCDVLSVAFKHNAPGDCDIFRGVCDAPLEPDGFSVERCIDDVVVAAGGEQPLDVHVFRRFKGGPWLVVAADSRLRELNAERSVLHEPRCGHAFACGWHLAEVGRGYGNELACCIADVDSPAAYANDRSGDLPPVARLCVKPWSGERVARSLRHFNPVLAIEDYMISQKLTPGMKFLSLAFNSHFGVQQFAQFRIRIVMFGRGRPHRASVGQDDQPVPRCVCCVPYDGDNRSVRMDEHGFPLEIFNSLRGRGNRLGQFRA